MTSAVQDFYEDIFEELAKYGEIENLNVCDNLADHMVGSVYVKFADENGAAAALQAMQGRYYGGRPIQVGHLLQAICTWSLQWMGRRCMAILLCCACGVSLAPQRNAGVGAFAAQMVQGATPGTAPIVAKLAFGGAMWSCPLTTAACLHCALLVTPQAVLHLTTCPLEGNIC